MSFVLLGILNSQAAAGAGPSGTFFFSNYETSLNDIDVSSKSNGDLVFAGHEGNVGSNKEDTFIFTYDTDGTLGSQEITTSSDTDELGEKGLAVDSSDNIIVGGLTVNIGSGFVDWFISKRGVWDRTLGGGGDERLASLNVDASDNVYCGGFSDAAGDNDAVIAKFDSSGSIQWQRRIAPSGTTSDDARVLAFDSSGNVYVGCRVQGELHISKWNSSGSVQWQRQFNFAFGLVGMQTDGTNVYVSSEEYVLALQQSNGTTVWQKSISGGTTHDLNSIDVFDGNVYVAGTVDNTGVVLKLNSSGGIVWQRDIDPASQTLEFENVKISSSGDVLIAGLLDSEAFGAKLPNDGSLTGSYSIDGDTLAYAASSFTLSNSSLTNSSVSHSTTSTSLSVTSSALTFSTAANTSETTVIGTI